MDSNPTTTTNSNTFPTQTPATDTETPPQTQPFKSLSFSNGSGLKPHNHQSTVRPPASAPLPIMVVCSYKECLKNHAASMGGLALDGCGEFLPSPSATHSDPTSLKCGACGCHRNFHRRGTEDTAPKVLSIHRVSSPSPSPSPNTVCSPPPLSHLPPSQYYYSSVPQMLMSLSTASPQPSNEHRQDSNPPVTRAENPLGRKRFRTKFTQEQKQKMFLFCERLGWKMPKSNEMLVEFCNEVGVNRRVLKVWMHNNKNPLRKKEMGFGHNSGVNDDNGNGGRVSFETNAYSCKKEIDNNEDASPNLHVSANGSPS
ncbi:zinc-finger homeodomain protein 11-like [Juglans microcarpa x Juglans regia]|uniref:zinc-finger homeodomain protein 11-like n=1 Tax=Juglans microcarpa x Juglans regia TaxID=2249226 RepID=UPI001B7DBA82|nr:zinc-finger homeodomain protein 11-like [Juglans microcarpa x Juglans regia]